MGVKKCFYCDEDISDGTGRIVPLDIPYVNIWAHRGTCADAMDEIYLKENIRRVYEYSNKQQNIKRKEEK